MGATTNVFQEISRGIGKTVTVYQDKKVQFRDSGLYLQSSADGQLDIVSDTTVAISGAVTMDSTLEVTGDLTVNGDFTFGDAATDNLTVNGDLIIADDQKMHLGTGEDWSIEYDEDGTDDVRITGADMVIDDDQKLYFGAGKDGYIEYDEDGNDTLSIGGTNALIEDDLKLYFGSGKDTSFEYDEDGTDNLRYDGADMIFDTATKLLFRDSALSVNSSADGQLDLAADTSVVATTPTATIQPSAAGTATLNLKADASAHLAIAQADGAGVTLTSTSDGTAGFTFEGGILTLDNGATLDNTTSATVLTITETTIELTGAVDISGATTIGSTLDVGTYSSMTTAASGVTTELVSVGLTGAEDDYYIGLGCYVRATGEDGKPFGIATTIETTDTTGIDRMQAGQFISLLGTAGGSEAAHLKTLGGDAVAGMYGVWAKVGANSNCVCDSGSRVAAIWVDNQMSGTVSGEEYGIFATTGASKPDAFIGFETTSSGWANFLSFDETSYDQDPVASATISGGTQDKYLKVDINGTAYGIPLYTGW